MKKTWLVCLISLSLLSPSLLSGCQSQPSATAPSPAGDNAATNTAPTEKRAIKVNPSWLLQGDNAPITIAKEKGYFGEEGLDVTIERGFGSADTLAKVAAGQFEIGFGDMYSMIEFNAKNPNDPLVAVAVPYNKSPFSIVSLTKSNISDPKALEGKKLGAPAGDAPRKLWPVFAQVSGVDPNSVEWVTMEPKLRETFLLKGDVDAVSGFVTTIVPSLVKAGTSPDEMEIFLYADNGLDLYGNAIIVKRSFLQENPDVVKGFLSAYFKGLQDTLKDPAAGLASVMAAGDSLMDENAEKLRLQIALEDLYVTPEVEKNGLGGVDPARLEKTIEQVAKGLGVAVPKPEEVFDDSFLPPASERSLPPASERKSLS
ncbi:MAG: ABC transporter substrate-binding protein [Elainella sp. C42_A2020_010]|nr:ABC transporter substrate-binding protein [Elainella sp. C42_A2020_010]RNJ68751.1 MAG: Tat pathway signal protein [Leptolyngbya sp. IPPAS B-1204]